VTVCGDVHAQFYDVLEIFRRGGELPKTNYIFTGNFINKGYYSVETLELLLAYKARYPQHITLLRGNHESRMVSQVYGFYDEAFRKYASNNVWRWCMEVFDCLPIAALIDSRILCVHGGLSPSIDTIDDMRALYRAVEIPDEGPLFDCAWSNPDDILGWGVSRAPGYMFGADVVDHFAHVNGLELLCRSHQLIMEGYSYHFDNKNVLTVWSAPNYCDRCGNIGALFVLNEHLDREMKLFKNGPASKDKKSRVHYFF